MITQHETKQRQPIRWIIDSTATTSY